ncbi:hypothetical protein D0869_12931 [Hortaea werneckii]|uniref:F-box domain-containing protein n=2 Tax=Hortaea werneckii TaxID=91943 RepID=A0A3M6W6K4_HORWE|nr:hypothetical protein D0869_12931 [Hortaea werneckii]
MDTPSSPPASPQPPLPDQAGTHSTASPSAAHATTELHPHPSPHQTFTSTTSMRGRLHSARGSNSNLPDEGFSEGESRSNMSSSENLPLPDTTAPGASRSQHRQSAAATTHPLLQMAAGHELDVNASHLLAVCLDLPTEQRKVFVDTIVRSLPNRDKEAVGRLCEELTHFDPAIYLPNELMFAVLAYLSPKELLAAGLVSKCWREKAADEKLWRSCFAREGWVVDPEKLRSFEQEAAASGLEGAQNMEPVGKGKGKAHVGGLKEQGRKSSRKRKTEEAFSEGEQQQQQVGGSSAAARNADDNPDESSDSDGMEGVQMSNSTHMAITAADGLINFSSSRQDSSPSSISDSATSLHSTPSDHHRQQQNSASTARAFSGSSEQPPLIVAPPMWRPGSLTSPSGPKISWPWLFKHRYQLERNWERDDHETKPYRMFSLPHQDHPEEGHQECVYTLQHTSKHLVSGSRDRTIRKWDLRTQRLIGKPLEGHGASVLCLQFDERPEEDIIISGGSDALVIIWQFSTGKIQHIMRHTAETPHPHSESVLNLRFDDRYLVTCSKDKTIKVWNRRALSTTDPLVPTHAFEWLDPTHNFNSAGNMVREWSMMARFEGHQAAVNAVMIHGDTIISASGDRQIKAWSILRNRIQKTYTGHNKGIACVQFDGRRIVSGSSDNTVRIFDGEQLAEVGCLQGHENLVRTVQARFGDLDTVTDEELESEAREADQGFFKALEAGMMPASSSRRRSSLLNLGNAGPSRAGDHRTHGQHPSSYLRGVGQRNAGSSRPEDMLSVGTKIPPGGGGSRWAKIVSGSYDERVIVWKRDFKSGRWMPRLQLKQDEILNRGMPEGRRRTANMGRLMAAANGQQQQQQEQAAQVPAGAVGQPNPTAQPAAQNQQQQGPATAAAAAAAAPPAGNTPAFAAAQQAYQQQQQQQQHHHHHHHGQHAPARHHSDTNRVFKLQFDARRLICCSQNKVIVGWDFADGQPELERVGEWSVETS